MTPTQTAQTIDLPFEKVMQAIIDFHVDKSIALQSAETWEDFHRLRAGMDAAYELMAHIKERMNEKQREAFDASTKQYSEYLDRRLGVELLAEREG